MLDAGNLFFSTKVLPESDREERVANAQLMLDAVAYMGTDAVNLSACDLAAGAAFLKEREHAASVPFLSANIKTGDTRQLVFKPSIIKVINNNKAGILGLTDNQVNLQQAENLFIDDPVTAAQTAVKELKEQGCTIIILLSGMQPGDNKRVAEQVPGIHFILGGSGSSTEGAVLTVGETAVLYAAARGGSVGTVELEIESASAAFLNIQDKGRQELLKQSPEKNFYRYTTAALNSTTDEDPHILSRIEKYKENQVRKKFSQANRSYISEISTVDLSRLAEDKKLMAIRLMNETDCGEGTSVSVAEGNTPLCTELARLIIDSISQDKSEGQIRNLLWLKRKEKGKN
ncbi:MAG: hypothetical protein NTZ51_05180 [Proteobacteria bacterium]|nr:hypothetical protein [Pseudomonadota bacterium]